MTKLRASTRQSVRLVGHGSIDGKGHTRRERPAMVLGERLAPEANIEYEPGTCIEQGCDTHLSRYNPRNFCALHQEPIYDDTGGPTGPYRRSR